MSERARKAAYRYVAALLEDREPHPPEVEVERIRVAMAAAGRQRELSAFDQLLQLEPGAPEAK